MSFSNTLKPVVDVPVWEWMRAAPSAVSSISNVDVFNAVDGRNRFSFAKIAGSVGIYKYDTQTDSWNTASGYFANAAFDNVAGLNWSAYYRREDGIFGTLISATSNTVNCAAADGKITIGSVIRIMTGKGAGQERLIVSASLPIIVENFSANSIAQTTSANNTIIDVTKRWKVNQYANYQLKSISGTGQGYFHTILWNNNTTICFADFRMPIYNPFNSIGNNGNDANASWNTGGTARQSTFTIEYSTLTMDKPWDIIPDGTSRFVIKTGGVWAAGGNAGGSYYTLQYLDLATNQWYMKRSMAGQLWRARFGDVYMCPLDMYSGSYNSASCPTYYATGAMDSFVSTNNFSTRSVIVYGGTGSMVPNQYAWYRFRQAHGPDSVILSNDSSSFTMTRDFEFTSSLGDTFAIVPDYDKAWYSGNGQAMILQYSTENDSAYPCPRYDWGIVNNGCMFLTNNPRVCIPIANLSHSGQIASFTSSIPHTFKDGDVISVRGALGADASLWNVSGVIFTGSNFSLALSTSVLAVPQFPQFGTYPMSGTPSGASASFSQSGNSNPVGGVSQINDASKNWATNEHIGKLCTIWETNNTNNGATAASSYQILQIMANTNTCLQFSASWTVNPLNQLVNQTGSDSWGYNIIDTAAFGAARLKGTGSMFFSGSTSGSQQYIFAVSGTTGTHPSQIQPMTMVTGSNIAPNTLIRGLDLFSNPATMSISIGPSGSNSNPAIYTCSFDSMSGVGIFTGVASTTWTDNTKVWPAGYWLGFIRQTVAGTRGTDNTSQGTIITSTNRTFTDNNSATWDTSSVYSIFPIQVSGNGTGFLWAAKSTLPNNAGKYIYRFNGNSTGQSYAYNITTNQWEFLTPNGGINVDPFGLGTSYAYDGDHKIYIQKDITGRIYAFDTDTHRMTMVGTIPNPATVAVGGNKMFVCQTEEGVKYLYVLRQSDVIFMRMLIPPSDNL